MAVHPGNFMRIIFALASLLVLLCFVKPHMLTCQTSPWSRVGFAAQHIETSQSKTFLSPVTDTIGAFLNNGLMAPAVSNALRVKPNGPRGQSLDQPSLSPFLEKPNHSTQFRAYITGDRHITLIPPKAFSALRKPPRVLVSLSRGNQAIQAEVVELANLVHILAFPRSEAFGILNVTIQTISTPSVNQTIPIEFRSSWLGISTIPPLPGFLRTENTIETLYAEAEKAQDSLSNMTLPILASVQMVIGRIDCFRKASVTSFQTHGAMASTEAKRLANSSAKVVSDATDTLVNSLQGFAVQYGLFDVPRIRGCVLPVLKPGTILEARRKAKRIVKKLTRSGE